MFESNHELMSDFDFVYPIELVFESISILESTGLEHELKRKQPLIRNTH